MLCVPNGVIDSKELFLYGLIKAISCNVPIKHCIVCSKHNKELCRNKKETDDLYIKASMCGDYYFNRNIIGYLLMKYKRFNYITCYEWKRDTI